MNCTIRLMKTLLLLALLLMAILGSGCSRQDWTDLIDIGKAWAQAHDILYENGLPTLTTLDRVLNGTDTGDEDMNAIIDAGAVVNKFNDAETLSREGRKNHDIAKVNQAIDLRPEDYGYRNQRGAMLFIKGDDAAAEQDYTAANGFSGPAYTRNLESRANYLKLEMSNYESPEYLKANNITGEQNIAMRMKYKAKMMAIYKELYEKTGNPQHQEQYDYFNNWK